MVKEGEFIDFAIALKSGDITKGESILPTETRIIVELAKKVKELELRIKVLEDAEKRT